MMTGKELNKQFLNLLKDKTLAQKKI